MVKHEPFGKEEMLVATEPNFSLDTMHKDYDSSEELFALHTHRKLRRRRNSDMTVHHLTVDLTTVPLNKIVISLIHHLFMVLSRLTRAGS
jgi:hypothetical protein